MVKAGGGFSWSPVRSSGPPCAPLLGGSGRTGLLMGRPRLFYVWGFLLFFAFCCLRLFLRFRLLFFLAAERLVQIVIVYNHLGITYWV